MELPQRRYPNYEDSLEEQWRKGVNFALNLIFVSASIIGLVLFLLYKYI